MTHSVLLVDEDVDLRLLLTPALEAHGFVVLQAGSASEALTVLERNDFALLVVDSALPDESGEELVAACRVAGYGGPIVYTTIEAPPRNVLHQLVESLQVTTVAYKPIAPLVFARRMSQLLGQGNLDAAGQEDPLASRPTGPGVAPTSLRRPLALELDQLEQGFGQRLPHKLAELAAALHRGKSDPTAIVEAMTLAHRLRGTAGSYGYQDVGDLVGGIEDTLNPLLDGAPRRGFFWDEVERSLRDAVRCAQGAPNSASGSDRLTKSRRHSLLVVDGDIDFLRLIRSYGRRHSLQVITAHSVEDGVESAATAPLTAALLDVQVGGVDLRQAVQRIRATPGNEELPIFFASADPSLSERMAAVEAGGSRFLDKPLSEHQFSEMVQQVPFCEAQASRIVILDDDEIVLEKYESELRAAGYFVCGICDPNELVGVLEDVRPDVLLMDVNLEEVSGIDICKALRCSQRWQFFPILMFSGDRDADMRVRAFQAGASDVLAKPLSVEELMMRVSVHAERIRLIRERSDRDALSGLMLRRAFVESLQRSLGSCSREEKPLAFVLFDLDHFKNINDTYGHLMGDRVIAAFGELLRRRFRVEDLRGRWGGEEFVLAFPGQAGAFARSAAERLLKEFSAIPFETEGGELFHVTFTAGVSVYPHDGESLDLLVKRADELLYEGKEQGRARVCTAKSMGPAGALAGYAQGVDGATPDAPVTLRPRDTSDTSSRR